MPLHILFTVGHSTHPIDAFIEILLSHRVQELVDVRTVPKSRHCPQFNADALHDSLRPAGIGYTHLKALGGLRKTNKDSLNLGWRNLSFRGYADYMATPDFERGLDQLVEIASARTTTIMCAEAVPWRCHRSLIGDAIATRGWTVQDIMGVGAAKPHKLTPFLKVVNGRLTYPALDEPETGQ